MRVESIAIEFSFGRSGFSLVACAKVKLFLGIVAKA